MNSDLKLLKILDRVGNCLPCHSEYVLQYLDSQYISTWNVKYICSDQNFDIVHIIPQIYVLKLCPPLLVFFYLLSLTHSIKLKSHNQAIKVPMNFLDQEKCSSKCHSDILAQKLPLKIIGEGWQHEPNLPAVCLWKSSVFDNLLLSRCRRGASYFVQPFLNPHKDAQNVNIYKEKFN